MTAWSVVVPVKSAMHAKSRLAPAYGRWRPLLARAFALDTIGAVSAATSVRELVVVTDDHELRELLEPMPHVAVVTEDGHGDLNGSIGAGLRAVDSGRAIAVVTSDLPAVTSADIDQVLGIATDQTVAVVADRERRGTTVLTIRTPAGFHPRFGPDSLRLHRASGAVELDVDAPGVRRDVDLPEHLSEAARIGVGSATARVLERIRNGTGPVADPVP